MMIRISAVCSLTKGNANMEREEIVAMLDQMTFEELVIFRDLLKTWLQDHEKAEDRSLEDYQSDS